MRAKMQFNEDDLMSDLIHSTNHSTSACSKSSNDANGNGQQYSDVYIHPEKMYSLISNALCNIPDNCFMQTPVIDTAVIEYVLPNPPHPLSSRGWVLRQEYRNIRSIYYAMVPENASHYPSCVSSKICMTGSMIGHEKTPHNSVSMIVDTDSALPRRMVDTILASSNYVPRNNCSNFTPTVTTRHSESTYASQSEHVAPGNIYFNPMQSSGSSICAFSAQSDTDIKGLELGSAPETFLLSCASQYNLVHGLTNVRAYLESPCPVPVQHPEMMQSVHHLRIFRKSDNQGFEVENQENCVNWTRTDPLGAMQMHMPVNLWIVRIRAKTTNQVWKEDILRLCSRLTACIGEILEAPLRNDCHTSSCPTATKKRRLNDT